MCVYVGLDIHFSSRCNSQTSESRIARLDRCCHRNTSETGNREEGDENMNEKEEEEHENRGGIGVGRQNEEGEAAADQG